MSMLAPSSLAPHTSNSFIQEKFDAELAARQAELRATKNSTIKTASLLGGGSSSQNTWKPPITSSGVVPSVAARLSLPAYVAAETVKFLVPKIKDMYYDKMQAAGIKLPAGVRTNTIKNEGSSRVDTFEQYKAGNSDDSSLLDNQSSNSTSGYPEPIKEPDTSSNDNSSGSREPLEEPLPPEPLPLSPPSSGENLMTVLKDSSVASQNIASSNDFLGKIFAEKLSEIVATLAINKDIDVAYKELELKNSIETNEINLSYQDAMLSNIVDIAKSLERLSNQAGFNNSSGSPVSINVKFPDEIKIKKTESEIALTDAKLDMTTKNLENHDTATDLLNKKLEHITFETTDFQAPIYDGNDIPSATPQTMRAIKDAHVAKKNNDENTFEVEPDDFEDMFAMPDLNEIFTWYRESERISDVASSVGSTA